MFCFLLWILLAAAVVVWNLELLHWWGFGTSEQKVSAGCLGRYRENLSARQNRSMPYKVLICWMESLPCLIRCWWLWYLFQSMAWRLEEDDFKGPFQSKSFHISIIHISWLENYKGLPLLWTFMPCPCVSGELSQEAYLQNCWKSKHIHIWSCPRTFSLSLPFHRVSCVKKLQFISPLYICRNSYC